MVIASGSEAKLKLPREAKALLVVRNHLFIGYSSGLIEIYTLGTLLRVDSFTCGTTPIRRFCAGEKEIFAFSNRSCCLSEDSKGGFTRKDIMIDDVAGFLQIREVFVIAHGDSLQLAAMNRSVEVNIE